MKRIALTQGKVALVDDGDFPKLNKFKWWIIKAPNTYYACCNENNKKRYMHRMILGVTTVQQVDHINHNGLNNQRDNIRLCSRAQNQMNQQRQKNTSSQFKGVSWNKQKKKWEAYIMYRKQRIALGSFKKEEAAARAYDGKAREIFGEFANPNIRE